MARGRRPSIGCLVFERAANGARLGLGHHREVPSIIRLHINTLDPTPPTKIFSSTWRSASTLLTARSAPDNS